MKKGILLSGGMDSIALAYWKKPEVAFTIDYGQTPALAEIRASETVAKLLGIEHHIIRVDCKHLGSGDLVNETSIDNSPSSEWWPYRNQLLVTLTAMKAINLGVNELMLASVKSDGFHKDGTTGFYERINELMKYQEGELSISCPSIDMTTVELVQTSQIPKEILFWSYSCHKAELACFNCRGCNKYFNTVRELGYI